MPPTGARSWRNGARSKEQGDWNLVVVERTPGTHGFSVQPRRWVVERSFAWLIRNRRLANDYERRVQTSETLIELAASRLLLRRLGNHACT
jgi:putative transposase